MKILVVDDSIFARNVIVKVLSKNFPQAQVKVAHNGDEGYKYWQEIKPDIVITDLLMPVLNGQELIQEIRKTDSNAKIIVVSADVQKVIKSELDVYGISDFINKPLNEEKTKQLVKTVNEVLDA